MENLDLIKQEIVQAFWDYNKYIVFEFEPVANDFIEVVVSRSILLEGDMFPLNVQMENSSLIITAKIKKHYNFDHAVYLYKI